MPHGEDSVGIGVHTEWCVVGVCIQPPPRMSVLSAAQDGRLSVPLGAQQVHRTRSPTVRPSSFSGFPCVALFFLREEMGGNVPGNESFLKYLIDQQSSLHIS